MEGADPDWIASSVAHVARHMRAQDLAEIEAMHGGEPHEVLAQSVALSSIGWIIHAGDEPVAVFGAAPSALPEVGIVWLLGTDHLVKQAHSFARQTPLYIDQMLTRFPILWNYIDSRNTVSMKWLSWGGFELLGDHRSPSGHLFHIFARSRLGV
jgi:hypothetical protein